MQTSWFGCLFLSRTSAKRHRQMKKADGTVRAFCPCSYALVLPAKAQSWLYVLTLAGSQVQDELMRFMLRHTEIILFVKYSNPCSYASVSAMRYLYCCEKCKISQTMCHVYTWAWKASLAFPRQSVCYCHFTYIVGFILPSCITLAVRIDSPSTFLGNADGTGGLIHLDFSRR